MLDALDPPVRKMEQINFYLDTPSRVLHNRKVMLRMRKQGDEAIFTLKTDAEIVRGGLRCREVEERIPGGGGRRSGWIPGFYLVLEEVGTYGANRPSRRDWSGRESTPMDPVEDLGTVEPTT